MAYISQRRAVRLAIRGLDVRTLQPGILVDRVAQLMAKTGVFGGATAHDRDVFKPTVNWREGLFPHPPNAIYPTLITVSPFVLPRTFDRIPMAYFNGVDNPDFYASSASSELEAYPFLGQGSAWPTTGGSADQTYSFSSSYWTTAGQPGPPAGSPTSLRATAGYGKHCCHVSIERAVAYA